MEPTDPNFLVQKPKKERTPAQKLATQTAFTKLKEKRDSIREEREEQVVIKKPTVKAVPKVAEPIVVEEKSKPVVSVENKMNDEMINSIVSRLKTEMASQPVKEKKKKVVVVEEDSSSEEEIVIRRKKIPVKASEHMNLPACPEQREPVKEVKRSTGSRVLDNLFYSK